MAKIHSLRWNTAVCLAVALALASCGGEQAEPREAADAFFQQVLAGKTKEAYESTAFAFQSQQSVRGFESAAAAMGIAGASRVETAAPEIEGDTAKLSAEAHGRDGKRQPLVVTLHRESGAWRIFSLKTPRSLETGLSENRFSFVGKATGLQEAANLPIPDEAALRELTKEAINNFSEAIRQKSFSDFYDYVSYHWQQQLTRSQLHEAFKAFIERGVDLSALANLEPRFDGAPQVTADGILSVTGHYDTQPYVVGFALKFIYELPAELLRKPERVPVEGTRDWKLFGIDVNLRK